MDFGPKASMTLPRMWASGVASAMRGPLAHAASAPSRPHSAVAKLSSHWVKGTWILDVTVKYLHNHGLTEPMPRLMCDTSYISLYFIYYPARRSSNDS